MPKLLLLSGKRSKILHPFLSFVEDIFSQKLQLRVNFKLIKFVKLSSPMY